MKANACEKCIHYRRGECHRKICLLMDRFSGERRKE